MNEKQYEDPLSYLQTWVPSVILETALFGKSNLLSATLVINQALGIFTLLIVFSTYILASVEQDILLFH
jgi:hypothetical protein